MPGRKTPQEMCRQIKCHDRSRCRPLRTTPPARPFIPATSSCHTLYNLTATDNVAAISAYRIGNRPRPDPVGRARPTDHTFAGWQRPLWLAKDAAKCVNSRSDTCTISSSRLIPRLRPLTHSAFRLKFIDGSISRSPLQNVARQH
jgi:hypothetical protein